MRMCRCAGRARLRGRLRAGVAVAARAVSRQEIETCLVKRARRSIHASFWVFHQSARIYDALDAAARGDFAKTCAAMASTLWQLQRCAACFGAARCNPAALHCHWFFNDAQSDQRSKSLAAGRCWLQIEHPRWSARSEVERFACCTVAKASPAAAWARALFIEHNLEPLLEESCGALCCSLATFGQARHPLSQLAHFVVSLALCAAVRVERIASSSRSVNQLPH